MTRGEKTQMKFIRNAQLSDPLTCLVFMTHASMIETTFHKAMLFNINNVEITQSFLAVYFAAERYFKKILK